jgi:hypothetical protein
MASTERKLTLMQILADPKNREVSAKFFRFSFIMILLPVAFLITAMKTSLMSTQTAGIVAVVMVNIIMVTYALSAYAEEKTVVSTEKKTS